jgi:hypothetical protein
MLRYYDIPIDVWLGYFIYVEALSSEYSGEV